MAAERVSPSTEQAPFQMAPDDFVSWSGDERSPSSHPLEESPPRGTGRRKGHRKSRRGCLACKRRKVKCQETRPSCANCIRNKLECEYPDLIQPPKRKQTLIVSAAPQATPITFDMVDLRIFHHFMIAAHPHLPLGYHDKWVTHIPSYAHHYGYLMHSMLALGGAHLTAACDANFTDRSKDHRLRAIKGLNEVIQKDSWSSEDHDAMLATAYALTFLTAFLGESLGEFFTCVRGIALILIKMRLRKIPSVLSPEERFDNHARIMGERLEEARIPIEEEERKKALSSLNALQPYCELSYETLLIKILVETVEALPKSSKEAYFLFVRTYEVMVTMSHEDFKIFLQPSHGINAAVQAHFIAVQELMSPILVRERADTPIYITDNNLIQVWLPKLRAEAPRHVRRFMEWPLAYGRKSVEFYQKLKRLEPGVPVHESREKQQAFEEVFGSKAREELVIRCTPRLPSGS